MKSVLGGPEPGHSHREVAAAELVVGSGNVSHTELAECATSERQGFPE